MKNISRYIILFGVLVLFIGVAPRFLFLDKTQQTITNQLSKKLGSQVTVHEMHWIWLPLPHLSFSNTRIINAYSEFSVPKMKIYLNWRAIFNKELILGSIHLVSPEIFINKKALQAGKSSKLTLPEIKIFIEKGVLKVEANENYRDVLLSDDHTFNNIDGMIKMEQQKAELDLHGSSPFSRDIGLMGHFNLNSNNYQFFLDVRDIKLHQSVAAFLQGHLIPKESNARLAGSITGTGLQNFAVDLHGTLPSFTVLHKNHETLLTPGFTDFTLLKSGPLLRLTIKDLEMREPQLNLSGHIERKPSEANNDLKLQATLAEPTWTLDLTGNDLDLTTIRHKILTLWGDNKVAETVCGVVLGGKAVSAAFRFSGPSADFKDLDAMIIEADVLEADIHVPGAELDLTKANGPVLIKDSILTGHNLSAQMDDSYGSNAELLLDLNEESNAFTLDIDIDADLKALPPVLKQLVHHDGFLQELNKFKDVSGRASGNLHLGDTLDNIITRVKVGNMKLSAHYAPIPKTVFIDKGALQVGPKEVSWQNVKGRIGLQEIMNTSGNVSWQTGDTLLHVKEMQGLLDGKSLYAMLEQTGVMPQKIKGNLSSLQGSMEVAQGVLKGPASKPEAWEYQLAVNSKEISFTSPLLPDSVTTKKLSAVLSDKEANIEKADVSFLDQPLSLKGTLHHQELENWHGTIEFNGPYQAKLNDWIESKEWLPEKLSPRTPCTLENLNVSFKGEKIGVRGKILHGLTGDRLPMARIDLINTPEQLRINELTFFAPGEQGSLSLDFRRLAPKNFSLSWHGLVNADTIDMLFHNSAFTNGTFVGDFFEASFFADLPNATRFKGLLKAENLLLKASKKEMDPTVFKTVLLNGTGKQLKIAALNLAIGTENITGLGHLAAEQNGLQLDLDLTSSSISKESLNDLVQGLKEDQHVFSGENADQNDDLLLPKEWDITGRIGFDFDSYSVSRKSKAFSSATGSFQYVLFDVHGELQIAPDKITRTEIFSSKLCGLNFKSTRYSREALGEHFELATGPDTTLRLENVLPCLGVDQDLIEGEFSLKTNLRKESGAWHSGNIHIKSTEGRILKLKLLSNIFKVVNITDLFESQISSTGKKGFPFSQMLIDTHIQENNLIFDRAILHGEGLNLFLKGNVHLDDYDADLTILIAPFKTFDTLFSKVPFIGQEIMSEYDSLVAIPVAIQGQWPDPTINLIRLESVGDTLLNVVKETFKLPYNILTPYEETIEDSKDVK
jgi:hypothetical protein